MGLKMKRLKSVLLRDLKVNWTQLYKILFCVFILFLSFGGFQVLKECCLETKRTFAIITSDYRSKRPFKREFTYEYQVDGERYKGKIRYSGESIASVGDTCYVIYEVRNKENARVVCSRFWGYVDSPVVVKRK